METIAQRGLVPLHWPHKVQYTTVLYCTAATVLIELRQQLIQCLPRR